MEIRRSKSFTKAFSKLNGIQQKRVETAVTLFTEDRSNPSIRDHPLKGRMDGYHAFSAAWDLRIIYREEDNFVTVILIDVGTHNQVY